MTVLVRGIVVCAQLARFGIRANGEALATWSVPVRTIEAAHGYVQAANSNGAEEATLLRWRCDCGGVEFHLFAHDIYCADCGTPVRGYPS